MKHKLLSLFVALIATTILWASNTITYTATEKLSGYNASLNVGKTTFGPAITSHTFSNDIGTITCNGEITRIGSYAFYGCRGLTSIEIPNSVTSIGWNAFSGCTSLPVIDNIRYADTYLIEAVDKSLSTYTIREGTKWIGEDAFYNCSGLTSIEIPNSATTIENDAFRDCAKLTSVTIGNSVTTIGGWAFGDCSSLTSITIPSSVTTIGSSAFYNCTGLTKTNYTGTVADWCKIEFDSVSNPMYYSHNFFINEVEVKNLVIPEGVEAIRNYAFYRCSGLTSITIPNSVITIGYQAFDRCDSLASITCEATTPPMCRYSCFYSVDKSIPLYVPVQSVAAYKAADEWKAFTNILPVECLENTPIHHIDSITTCYLEFWHNKYCYESGDYYDTIPNCFGCDSIIYQLNLVVYPSYYSEDTIQINKGDTIFHNKGTRWQYYEIPTRTGWSLHADTFQNIYGCDSTIRHYYVIIHETELTCPEYSVCGICGDSLTWVLDTIAGTIVISGSGEMDNYAIYGNTNHDTILAPWTSYNSTISKVVINDGVITIGNDAFINCKNISQVELGNTVTTIGSRAFSGCSLLKEIRFPESLTTLKAYAFGACGFDSIFIPKTLTNIYYIIDNNLQSPFRLCRSLKRIIIEEGNPNYDSRDDCNAIIESKSNTLMFGCVTSIIPNTITTIAGHAFYGTSDMIEISIPKNVSYIGDFAFGLSLGSKQRIYCEAVTPPIAFENTFSTWPNDIPVYVPAQSIALYKTAKGWKEFTNIIGICEGDPYFSVQDTIICGRPYPFVWEGDTVRYDGEVWHWGNSWSWYNHVDTVTRNYISVGGCDSILQLVVYYPGYQYELINDTIEEGQSHWSEYTETGIYYKRYPNVYGCDSTVLELHLYVMPKPIYMVTISVNNAKYGSVEGAGTYNKGDTVILSATPNKGYQFNQWSDGNTDNPRTIYNIDKDYTLTAQFGIKQCSWLVESNDLEMGAVYTDFTNEYYNYGTQITVEASANSGYKFVKWNDGKKYNPYKFSILEDKYLLAIFMAEEEEMDTTQVQPSDTTATFTWSFVAGGYTYTLTIYMDADCTIPLCTLTFDQNGQLTGITFSARAPRRSKMANQEEGFTTTINGLSAGTQYFYKMETRDKEGKLLNTDEGGFSTQNSGVITNTDKVAMSIPCAKFIKDNQLFIFRGGKIYSVAGVLMK